MMKLMIEGGVPMWFVLLFGLISLLSAAYFAARPTTSALGFIRWMMGTTVFAILSGTFSAFGATFHYLSESKDPGSVKILYEGLGESMSAGTLGFTLLALSALLSAVGQKRLSAAVGA
jgi:hypothetical protein